MTDKVEGATQKCQACGQLTVCREIDYQGIKKLQWQDEGENKAHYSFDFKTKNVACKHIAQTPLSPEQATTGDLNPKSKDPTPEQFLEIAKKLLADATEIKDIDAFVSETAKVTRRAAAKTAVRWATIISTMDEIGLQHPSRIAFIKDVLK